jgi:peptidoglycan/LPS O-acetylase OafA/YrhL
MYLLHQHIGYILLNRFEGVARPALLIAATTIAVTAASWLTWRYVERPAQKWMKRILSQGQEFFGSWVAAIRSRMVRAPAK